MCGEKSLILNQLEEKAWATENVMKKADGSEDWIEEVMASTEERGAMLFSKLRKTQGKSYLFC